MPRFHDPLIISEGAVPGTPGTAEVVVYIKADGKPYFKDDAGIEWPLLIPVGTAAPTSPGVGALWVDTN